MDDPSRHTKLPSSTSIKQIITPDNSATPAPEQKKIQARIADATFRNPLSQKQMKNLKKMSEKGWAKIMASEKIVEL